MRKLTTDEFVNRFTEKFPDNLGLDVTQIEYITAHKKVTVICQKHKTEVSVTPSNLMKGSKGCRTCRDDATRQANGYDKTTFVQKAKEAHGDSYDYSLVEWNGSRQKVKIICKKHGVFEQNPQGHYNGYGCRKCGWKTLRKSQDEFVTESNTIHNNQYTYEKVDYINNYTPLTISCKKHGDFNIVPSAHTIYQRGCPDCYPGNVSWCETAWLDTLNIPKEKRQKRLTLGSKSYVVDALMNNTVYEFWGDYWHGNPKTFLAEDKNTRCGKTFGELFNKTQEKRKAIITAGYDLIEIWESEWQK